MVKQNDKGVRTKMRNKKLKDPKKSAYMKKFYQEHKEYFTNYNREYYQKRKNELKKRSQEYNEKNSDKIKKYLKEYYKKNRTKYKGYTGARGNYKKNKQ